MPRLQNKKYSSEPSITGLRIKINEIANFYEGTEKVNYYSVRAVKEVGVLIILKNMEVSEQTDFVVRGYVEHYAKQMSFKVKKKEGNKIVNVRIPVKQIVFS